MTFFPFRGPLLLSVATAVKFFRFPPRPIENIGVFAHMFVCLYKRLRFIAISACAPMLARFMFRHDNRILRRAAQAFAERI